MMRSIAASMSGSGWSGNCGGFELGDRLVGKLELVDLAAMKHPYDDLEQPFVGGDVVRNRAGAAQIVGGDGVGVAHHLHIQDTNSTFDQHGPISSASRGDKFWARKWFQFGKRCCYQHEKSKAHRPKTAGAPGEAEEKAGLAGLLKWPA